MSERHWIGEAEAAFDEGMARLPEGDFGTPEFWLQRAQAAAAIAAAEQARIGNLIAWKQLQATRATAADQGGLMPLGGADEISADIEAGLGITDPEPPTLDGLDL